MENVLNLMGLSEEGIKEAKVEPSVGSGWLWESGAYKVEVKQVAIFETERKAKMLKIELYDETEDKTLVEYANTSYIDKKTGEVTENKGGAHIFKALMSAIKLEPSQCVVKSEEIKAYGKDIQAQVIDNAAGRKCVALVRQVEDPNNEKYPDSNTVEGFADIQNNINGSTEAYDKWLAKLEKAPVLVKKGKKKVTATTASTEASKDAALNLLD